jgi:hypothetical protein
MTVTDEWHDAMALNLAMVEGNERVLAALRACWRHAFAQGWQAGYDRSFERAPADWKVGGPDWEQLQRRRGEHPDQDPPGEPRPGDYPGGPVPPW